MKKNLRILVILGSMVFTACGETEKENNVTTNQNNGTTNQNNGTTNQNNGTTNQNNGTTNQNNGTTNQNNGTTNQNNGTTNQNCIESTVVGPCDALCQTGCEAGTESCVAGVFTQGSPAEEICEAVGAGLQGDACGQDMGCVESLGCLGGACQRYCRLPHSGTDCGNDEVCVSVIARNVNIGICRASCTVFPDSCAGTTQKCTQVTATTASCGSVGPKAKVRAVDRPGWL